MDRLHNVIIDAREKLTANGIIDVKSFDETLIVGKTDNEAISIKGENLHIDTLDLDAGKLSVTGTIDSVVYSGTYVSNETIWEKLFR
ncbi:MAG: YabP/YqfC family sporulation protein [Clostridia bacterium]|nr:YabP/YqfC family sporulation protein [Clostridia bacterium]